MAVPPQLKQGAVLVLLMGGALSLAAAALWLRDKFRKDAPAPKAPKAADLPSSEQRRLRRSFWARRNAAIAGFVLPILLWAGGAFFAESLRDVRVLGRPLALVGAAATFAAWGLDLLFMLLFLRCPLCGRVPLSLLREGDGTYDGRQKSYGLDLSPDSCRGCGLNFKET